MKMVVFAHTPPPLHGQSYMVELLLKGFGGDWRNRPARPGSSPGILENAPIQCFHVNARFSGGLEDVGLFRFGKVLSLLKYCLEAIACRFRYGIDTFYYIPAPPKRIAFYRDCLVLLLCRPFFRYVVFHWQASGLGYWLERDASSGEQWMARRLLGFPDLSITLATSLSADANYLLSKRTGVTPNAIADPCPAFEQSTLPYRLERLARRREILAKKTEPIGQGERYEVLFLAHCTREKGLFDLLQAIAQANQLLNERRCALGMHVTVAGAFLDEGERQEFETWRSAHADEVEYAGFLAGEAKNRLLQKSDCFCLPTYYSAEAQPVSIVEAMAFGLTVVATRWRGIPELLPKDYAWLTTGHDPEAIAEALLRSVDADLAGELRRRYGEMFTEERYVDSLTKSLQAITLPEAKEVAGDS